jgi:LmbE family N-acetylglucosaminyl deacetylase
MATLVTFHAHPDDEALLTGGTMARAAAEGHRVILVTATRGELGEPVAGILDDGEPLWSRRVAETRVAAGLLGAERVEFLGYEDSGMMGEVTNRNPACFWQAPVEAAAERLAAILTDVGADVLSVYDDHGGYGHPDHIQVHRVGIRAAQLAGVARVVEATMNRDRIVELMAAASERSGDVDAADLAETQAVVAEESFGSPAAVITHAVDVGAHLGAKRAAMEAHASQIAESSFFLAMPPDVFSAAFGVEWYIERGSPRAGGESYRDDLFAGLTVGERAGGR